VLAKGAVSPEVVLAETSPADALTAPSARFPSMRAIRVCELVGGGTSGAMPTEGASVVTSVVVRAEEVGGGVVLAVVAVVAAAAATGEMVAAG